MAATKEPANFKEAVALLARAMARIDELEGQVHNLESALEFDKTANVQAAFNLSETLAQLLIMLADGKPKNKERLHSALYWRRFVDEMPDTKILDKLVSQLRKAVTPHGIEIRTVWGNGYQLTHGRDQVHAVMERADAKVPA